MNQVLQFSYGDSKIHGNIPKLWQVVFGSCFAAGNVFVAVCSHGGIGSTSITLDSRLIGLLTFNCTAFLCGEL